MRPGEGGDADIAALVPARLERRFREGEIRRPGRSWIRKSVRRSLVRLTE